jgi:ABC-2 type transport system ATP-binding protein/lipopolysaccharide transport system ATP-binding protein
VAFLRLHDVSVEFPIYQASSRSLKKLLLASSTRGNLGRDAHDRVNVRALSNVSFEIGNGERFAVIGLNGAGKTTLLKVLAGVYEPTHGDFTSAGRVSSLLDIQVGLNVDATGRENIILRGMYMGIHPLEMRERAGAVAEFTELGEYLDMPVRTYSAGMMIRLAFAASTCVPPDILIMDEWLTAGDAQFLEKAQQRVEAFVRVSSILVLASHSLELVERWCNRGILLHQGRTVAIGPIKQIVESYRRLAATGAPPDFAAQAASVAAAQGSGESELALAPQAEPRAL